MKFTTATKHVRAKNSQINRRKFLANGLAYSSALSVLAYTSPQAFSAIKGEGASTTHRLSAEQHQKLHADISANLTKIAADPSLTMAQKSMALRTGSCPHCNTQIGASYEVSSYSAKAIG